MNKKLVMQIFLNLMLLLATTVFHCSCSSCPEVMRRKIIANYMINPSRSIENGAIRKFSGHVHNEEECRQKCCDDMRCNIAVYKPNTKFISEVYCVTYYCPSKKCILTKAEGVTIAAFANSNEKQQTLSNHKLPKIIKQNHMHLEHEKKPSSQEIKQSTNTKQHAQKHFRPHEPSKTDFNHQKISAQSENQFHKFNTDVNNENPLKSNKPSWQSNDIHDHHSNTHKPDSSPETSQVQDWGNNKQNTNTGKDNVKGSNGNTFPSKPDDHDSPYHPELPHDEANSNHIPMDDVSFQHGQLSNQDLPGLHNTQSHTNGHDGSSHHKFHHKPHMPNQQDSDHGLSFNKPHNNDESQSLGHDKPNTHISHPKSSPSSDQTVEHTNIHHWPNKHYHTRPTQRRPILNHQNHHGNQILSTKEPIANKGHLNDATNSQHHHQILHDPDVNTHNQKWPSHVRPTAHRGSPVHHPWNHKPTRYPDEKVNHDGSVHDTTNHGHKKPGSDIVHVKQHHPTTIIHAKPTPIDKQVNHVNYNPKGTKAKPVQIQHSKASKIPPTTVVHIIKTVVSQTINSSDKNSSVPNTNGKNQKGDGFTLVLHEDHHGGGLSNNERAEFTNLVVALGVALGVVIILLITVLLRLKRIHSRLRLPNPKDADFLINGMYL